MKPWKFKKTDEYVETTDSIIKSKDGSLTNTSILSQDIDKELILKQITRDEFNDRVIYKRFKSDASCKIDDITSFVFGGFSSRFWLLRKHISSMEVSDLKNLPFYCWECLTIQTIHKNINIVVKNEKDNLNKLLRIDFTRVTEQNGFSYQGLTGIKLINE